MKAWHVYLLRCVDNTYYCGIAKDVMRRLKQHNGALAGGAAYTRGRRPVEIIGILNVESKSQALRLEAAIKKLPKSIKREIFNQGDSECCQDLR